MNLRFFVTASQIHGEQLWLEPSDAQHVYRVLRMRPGDSISVCADNGMEYDCRLTQVGKNEVSAAILAQRPYSNEPSVAVTVYAGLSKGDRFEYLIQKCVECGVSAIVPFVSARCVARPDARDYEKKQQRYSRIAFEASKQCQRSKPVTVGGICSFADALKQAEIADCGLFLYEKEQQRSLSGVLQEAKNAGTYAVFTGPEGGFDPAEAELAQQAQLACVSIGPRILRCETAPVAALCAIMYQTGNFDIGV